MPGDMERHITILCQFSHFQIQFYESLRTSNTECITRYLTGYMTHYRNKNLKNILKNTKVGICVQLCSGKLTIHQKINFSIKTCRNTWHISFNVLAKTYWLHCLHSRVEPFSKCLSVCWKWIGIITRISFWCWSKRPCVNGKLSSKVP